jgi:hypothetical protein
MLTRLDCRLKARSMENQYVAILAEPLFLKQTVHCNQHKNVQQDWFPVLTLPRLIKQCASHQLIWLSAQLLTWIIQHLQTFPISIHKTWQLCRCINLWKSQNHKCLYTHKITHLCPWQHSKLLNSLAWIPTPKHQITTMWTKSWNMSAAPSKLTPIWPIALSSPH